MSLSRPYPKYYRMVLNSANATYRNGEYQFNVNLPTFDSLHTKVGWLIGVECFVTGGTPAGISTNGQGTFANLHMRELSQITSYCSVNKGTSDVILTFNSPYYANSFVTSSVALPITDERFFINKQLTFYFSDYTLTKTNEAQNLSFQVQLAIWHPETYYERNPK